MDNNTLSVSNLLGKYTAFGYQAATYSRDAVGSVAPLFTTIDYHNRPDLPALRARLQQLERDNSTFLNLINRAVANILGNGFLLNANTGDPELDQRIEDYWYSWCKSPENSDKFSFTQLEQLVLRHILIDGDLALIKTNTGKLSFIEADRIYSPSVKSGDGNRIESGIELDELGKPLRYYIAGSMNGRINLGSTKPYDAKDVIFLGNFTRGNQTRGVSPLVAVIPILMMLEDILTSEAISRQLQARIALIINRANADSRAFDESTEDPSKTGSEQIPARYTETDKALMFHGEHGDSVTGMQRTAPGTDIDKVVDTYLSQIGAVLGLSLELMKLDYSGVNFSASKASLAQSYTTFKQYQNLLIDRFHDAVYEWKLKDAVTKGLFPDKPSTFIHNWSVHNPPTIDPLKEAQAAGLNLQNNLTSEIELHNLLNKDTSQLIKQKMKYLENLYLEIQNFNKKFNTNLNFNDFINIEKKTTTVVNEPDEDTREDKEDAEERS